MPHPLAELVRASLPLLDSAGHELLAASDDFPETRADPDDRLRVGMRLSVRDEQGEVRAAYEQIVPLIAPEHAAHPGLAAWLRASLAVLPALLAEDPDACLLPSELFYPELLDLPDVVDEPDFRALLTDPVRRAAILADRDERERHATYVAAVGPEHAERLLALRRPRWLLTTTRVADHDYDYADDDDDDDDTATDAIPDGSTLPAATTRFGGPPGLPPGFAWPHAGGEPLTFLAQIDLGEFPPLPSRDADLLPRSGVLSLFLGLGGGEDPAHGPGRLFYFPDREALVRTAPPTATVPVLAELAVTPELDAPALPGWEQPHLALALETFDGAGSPYERAVDKIRGLLEWEGTTWPEGQPRHQLLGWPAVLQSDPLAAAAHDEREHLGAPHPALDSRPHAEDAAQWRLLLQVDSEDHDFMLGDAGMVHVVIREPDLRAGRFDRARIVWQMH